MSPTHKNKQIQALRALAAGLVLIYHAHWIDGGYVGVDIFYVISGFLITGLLLRELDDTNTLDLLRFYARRAKRLLPSSFLVIIVTGLVGYLLLPVSMRQSFGRDLIAAATYISNFLFAYWQNDYQNLNTTPSPFIHFWSLAVEEQFYLFWPFLVLVLYRFGKRTAVLFGVLSVFFGSFIFSLYLTERAPIWSFYILPTRAWELAAGALLCFLPEVKRFRPILALIALLSILPAVMVFDENTPFPGMAALLPVAATFILIATRDKWPPLLNWLVRRKGTQWIGEISYPLYLWHWPVLVFPVIYLGRELSTPEKIIALTITVGLAGITHRYLEAPMRDRNWSPITTLKSASFITAISLLLGISIYTTYSNTISFSDGTRYSLDEVRSKPINNEDGCHIHIRQTVSPKCEYGDISSDQVIVIYGDSHAAQWLPALDIIGKRKGIKIISLTKSACPSAEVIKELSSQYDIADCQAFRDSSVKRIAEIKPLAVIMTGMQPFTAPYSTESARDWWLMGEKKAYDRIKTHTQYPIYLTDTPLPRVDIPDCLAAARGSRCDTSRPVDPEVAAGLIPINPTPWLCSDTCPAVVDGIIAYRDKSHLTVAMSEHLSTKLESALRSLGLF